MEFGISRIDVCYKLFELFILQRVRPQVESIQRRPSRVRSETESQTVGLQVIRALTT